MRLKEKLEDDLKYDGVYLEDAKGIIAAIIDEKMIPGMEDRWHLSSTDFSHGFCIELERRVFEIAKQVLLKIAPDHFYLSLLDTAEEK